MRPGIKIALLAGLLSGTAMAADVPISRWVARTPLAGMTPDAFASAGLKKLSPQELQYLGRWMANYMSATATPAGGGDVIKTRIEGDYNGWEGKTVYKMMNGQVWQQSSYHYHYHYAFDPEVMIYNEDGRYKIHVQGDNDNGDVSVQRLN